MARFHLTSLHATSSSCRACFLHLSYFTFEQVMSLPTRTLQQAENELVEPLRAELTTSAAYLDHAARGAMAALLLVRVILLALLINMALLLQSAAGQRLVCALSLA